MTRINLVQKESASPEARLIYEKIESSGARILNLYKIMAYNPEIMKNVIRLGNSLLAKASLAAKLRELAIMRVAILTGSKYEWTQHYGIALATGITKEQVGALPNWGYSDLFSDPERAVLQYTDEVTREVAVKDQTFKTLKRNLNDQAVVELTLAVGYWGMLARLLVALEVDQETAGSLEELTGRKKA